MKPIKLKVPIDFHCILFPLFWKSMGSNTCLVAHILSNILFYVQENIGLQQHVSK